MFPTFLVGLLIASAPTPTDRPQVLVAIPLNAAREVDLAEVVTRLARATGAEVRRPSAGLSLPIVGLAGALTRSMLADHLGPEVAVAVQGPELTLRVDPQALDEVNFPVWKRRLGQLSDAIDRESTRRARYGMRARPSYRPNDPTRPTVCLVHGLNSSSGGFVHLIPPLEAAGYGVVVHDYPFNRSLAESSARFQRDWADFRRDAGETRPWAILAHSMGALIARSYVEDPSVFRNDVSTLVLIAPVNHGSSLAKMQTLMQWLDSVQAVKGKRTTNALASLSDGLGEAANDLQPGSAYLKALNARTRRAGVAYHILAGDAGFLTPEARARIEAQVETVRREGGMVGLLLARLALADLTAGLDELSDGFGDGCVSVAHTRLEGVADHVTMHANHAELIRAPLFFADPGPVACMPYVLRWLEPPSKR